jgi:hypothetical protein
MKYISIVLISILLAGCTDSQIRPINPTSIPTFAMPTSKPTITDVSTVTPNVTSVPILPFEEAQRQSTILLQTNNNCQLPCWWGIIPGKTKWQDAFLLLAPFGGQRTEDFIIADNTGAIFVRPPAPPAEHGDVLFHTYYIEKGIVKSMVIYNYNFAPITYFKNIIIQFGIPKEMYIRGHQDSGFRLALFYPEQGILAEYGRTITSSDQENVKVCYQDANSPFVYLWEANHSMSFEEAIVYLHVPIDDIPKFMSIDESLINLDEFMASLEKLQGDMCIETRKDLWPPQY